MRRRSVACTWSYRSTRLCKTRAAEPTPLSVSVGGWRSANSARACSISVSINASSDCVSVTLRPTTEPVSIELAPALTAALVWSMDQIYSTSTPVHIQISTTRLTFKPLALLNCDNHFLFAVANFFFVGCFRSTPQNTVPVCLFVFYQSFPLLSVTPCFTNRQSMGTPYLTINHSVIEHTTYSNLLNVAPIMYTQTVTSCLWFLLIQIYN